ncbi:hypothetical protein AAG906_003591 [Vitis piasezkii]
MKLNYEDDKDVKSFKDLGICEQLVEACVNLGWKTPSKIQAEAIPHALEDKLIRYLIHASKGILKFEFSLQMEQERIKFGKFTLPVFPKNQIDGFGRKLAVCSLSYSTFHPSQSQS